MNSGVVWRYLRPLSSLLVKSIPGQNVSEYEFLSPELELLATPPSPVRMALMMVICVFFVLGIGWASIAKVDIVSSAAGRIQPSGRSKVMQPFDPGRVKRILVRNGAEVHAGDDVIELESISTEADQRALTSEREFLAAEIARRSAALAAVESKTISKIHRVESTLSSDPVATTRENAVLSADLNQLSTSLQALDAKISESVAQKKALAGTIDAQQRLIIKLKERVSMREELAEQDFESRANVIDAIEVLDKEESNLAEKRGQILQADAAIQSLQREKDDALAKFVAENTKGLEAAETKFARASQEVVKATDKLNHSRLLAPIDGVVQELSVTTIGQVVTTGQQLLTIVPNEAALEVEANIESQDIGFVRSGQEAAIKVDTFPFTIYGTISGHVVRISHDAVEASEAMPTAAGAVAPIQANKGHASPAVQPKNLVFPATISLEKLSVRENGEPLPLSAGMTVVVEIKTGKRRVIDYLLSPLMKTTSEAINER